jgi:hypothetical protein
MLAVPHFQVVFTLPAQLREIAYDNPGLVYGLMMRSAASVLGDLAQQQLKARLGCTAVLHTWDNELGFHPHVHFLVTAGGLSLDGESWVPTRDDYLFPARIIGMMFRGRFLEGLIDAFDAGELSLRGDDGVVATKKFRSLVAAVSKRWSRWVVHVEPPNGRPVEYAAKYLARYIKRVAISDGRIVEVTDSSVRFRTRRGELTLAGEEFVRRYLLHVLPSGFRKVRHYGLYAPGKARERLEKARALVGVLIESADTAPTVDTDEDGTSQLEECPACGARRVRRVFVPAGWPVPHPSTPFVLARGPP